MLAVYKVLINSVVSFVYMFILAKLLGKKQVSQLNFVDYVIGISIGSIAAEYATDAENPWYFYVIGMGIFFLFDIFISFISRKAQWLKKFLDGQPIVLIKDGKIDYKELKKSKLDAYDLLMLAREEGYFDLNDIAFAIFEINGNLSILPRGSEKPTVVSDFEDIKPVQSSLTNYVVVDGKINNQAIMQLERDEKWVLDKMHVDNKNQLKSIFLASYDEELDKFDVHYKMSHKNKNKETIKDNKDPNIYENKLQ